METLSRGKRDPDLESVQTLSEWRNLHAYFEQKAELAVQGECVAQKRLSEAEAENGKKEIRNKEIMVLPSMKPIENLNL